MTGKTIRQYEMLTRVVHFGEEHAILFPGHTFAARLFAEVKEAVRTLEQHALTQVSSRPRAGARLKAAAREQLRKSIRAIGRTACAIDAPGAARAFRLPKTSGDHALLTAARAIKNDATGIAADLIGYGIQRTFLADVDAAIAAFEDSTSEYESSRQARTAATAGVDAVLARGLASLRRLDALVANVFQDDRQMVAAWRQARRVGRKGRSTQAGVAETAPIRLVANVA